MNISASTTDWSSRLPGIAAQVEDDAAGPAIEPRSRPVTVLRIAAVLLKRVSSTMIRTGRVPRALEPAGGLPID
jgi:hypothetical protein